MERDAYYPVRVHTVYRGLENTKTSLQGNHLAWASGDAIGLYAEGLQANVRMAYDGGDEFEGIFSPVQEGVVANVPYFAYYPYTASVEGTLVTMGVSAAQTAPFDSRNDFMVSSTAYGTYDESDLVIPDLTMNRHLCAIAQISIRCSNAAYSTYRLRSVTLSSAKSYLRGEVTFDARNGDCDISGTGKSIVLSYPEGKQPTLGSGTLELDAVLIPCSVDDLTVTITTDHGDATVSSSTLVNFQSNRLTVLPIITSFTLEGDPDPDPEDDRIPCVFMGDSITAFWASRTTFFADNGFLGKGVSGQWTSHMRNRFQTDVINNNPKAVIINGGVNNISHPYPDGDVEALVNDLVAMVEMAQAAGIKPILTTICPTGGGYKKLEPQIMEANVLIRAYAAEHEIPLVDYHDAMVGEDGYMPSDLASDGCHPTVAGYAIMEAACLPVINHVISQ